LLCSLKFNVRQWFEGRTPNTAVEAADIAVFFVSHARQECVSAVSVISLKTAIKNFVS
jgi:hypothetical protein